MKIITLTLSPAFDIHCRCDGFFAEHENLAHITSHDAGGKGVNISRALTVMGIENVALVAVGDENADSFLAPLSREGLNTVPFFCQGRIRENITLHAEGQAETRISFKGFSMPQEVLRSMEEEIYRICGAERAIVTLTGRVAEGIPMDAIKEMVARLKSKGMLVVIDSRSFTLADLIECSPYLIKPNEEEIVTYTGHPVSGKEDALRAARELYAQGIESVMISLGGDGAVLVSATGEYCVDAPTITPISTIGAGDSAIAGFIGAKSRGEDDMTCLRAAVAYGSAACLTEGTKSPLKEDILRFM